MLAHDDHSRLGLRVVQFLSNCSSIFLSENEANKAISNAAKISTVAPNIFTVIQYTSSVADTPFLLQASN